MNTETREVSDGISDVEARKVLPAGLADFTVNNFLDPYLGENSDNFQISESTASQLKLTVPKLIDDVFYCTSQALSEDTKLTLGGSSAEVFSGLISAETYWATKQHFIDVLTEKPQLNAVTNDAIRLSLQALAYGDPDLDLYVKDNKDLERIFNAFCNHYQLTGLEATETGGQQYKTKLNNLTLIVYLGPAYKGNDMTRLYFQLEDDQGRQLFHIDETAEEIPSDRKALDRRKTIGSVHDQCRGEIDVKTGVVVINATAVPKPQEQSSMKLEEKDIYTIPEIVMREMRKKLSHVAFDKDARNRTNIYQLFSLMETGDVFFLREFTSNPNGKIREVVEGQSDYQRKTLYKELFLMAQIDPYLTTVFLQDTGFDVIFFGRHLSRREILRILISPWLGFEKGNQARDDTPSLEKANGSRQNFLDLRPEDDDHNGFVRFVSAIGQALGSNPNEFRKHFDDGMNILQTQEELLPKIQIPANICEDEVLGEMYKTIVDWGGLTETALHNILSKRDNLRYPRETDEDKKRFRRKFLELKIAGVLEVARREVVIEDQRRQVYFYYPAEGRQKIDDLLPQKEGLTPTNPDYWQILIDQGSFDNFTKTSSIVPQELAHAWINFTILGITSIEALLGIRDIDWETIEKEQEEQLGRTDYEKVRIIGEFLISRNKEAIKEKIIKSWIDSRDVE